jgi:peroxiredoxin
MMAASASAQQEIVPQAGEWTGYLTRTDGKQITFHFTVAVSGKTPVITIVNGAERIGLYNVHIKQDSLFFELPVFESYFRVQMLQSNLWKGSWIKGTSGMPQVMPFTAHISEKQIAGRRPVTDISGRWAISFTRPDLTKRPAIGEWRLIGTQLSGTIITPTGDYRYLNGKVSGDHLELGTFDGSHAYLITAHIRDADHIDSGFYYAGANELQPWEAVKNANAVLPDIAGMRLKGDADHLHFRFRDLDGKWVSLADSRFKNKVVVIQIMGSWCPNCMDETAFLSAYYRKNKARGIEIVGLAYEYSTDPVRSRRSMEKFRNRFRVTYPLLNTGVAVSDTLRTEKTLPELTPIKSFPTTIFLDRDGRVAKIHPGFEGPGTGVHYLEWQTEFNATIDELLKKQMPGARE